MSAEPIDIVVTDKVPASVQNKFLNIASAALEAATNVDKVNAALKAVNTTPLAQLATAQERIASATTKANTAYLSQETALNKAIAAEAKAVTASEKLELQSAKTSKAQAEASLATERLSLVQAQTALTTAKVEAATKSESVSLIEKARATQIAAAAQAEYNRILGVGQPTSNSAKASASVFLEQAAAEKEAAKSAAVLALATAKLGETEEAAAARIRTMVAASLAQAEANKAVSASASGAGSKAAVGAAIKAADTGEAARYAAQMTAIADKTRDAAIAQKLLGDAQKAANIGKVAGEVSAIGKAFEELSFKTAGAKRELLVLAHELSQGQFSRFGGSLLVLGERTGAASLLFSALGLAVVGTVGAIIGFIAIVSKADSETAKLNNALAITGNYANLTQIEFADMSKTIAASTDTSEAGVRKLLTQIVASGQISGNAVEQVAQSSLQISKLTGESADKIAAEFIKAADAPTKYAYELESKFKGIISPALVAHVQELERTGHVTEAFGALSEGVYTSLADVSAAKLGFVSRAWKALGNEISNTLDKLASIGATKSPIEKANDDLEKLTTRLAEEQSHYNDTIGGKGEGFFAKLLGTDDTTHNNKVNAILEQIDAAQSLVQTLTDQSAAQAAATKTSSEGTLALQDLSKNYAKLGDNAEKSRLEIAKLDDSIEKARASAKAGTLGTDGQKVLDDITGRYNQIVSAIHKRNEPAAFKAGKQSDTDDLNRDKIIAKTTDELNKQLNVYGQLSEVRSASEKLAEVDIKLTQKSLKALTDDEKTELATKFALVEANKKVTAAQDAIYRDVQGPIEEYSNKLKAINNLTNINAISEEKANEQRRAAAFAYKQQTDPLFAINRSIADQTALLGLNNQEMQLASQLQSIENGLLVKGMSLYDEQTKALTEQGQALKSQLGDLQKKQELQQAINTINEQGVEAERKLMIQQQATTAARQAGTITADDYLNRMVQIRIEAANLNLSRGIGTFEDAVTASLGRMLEGYKGLAAGGTAAFGDFFSKFTDGFANSVGRAIVYSEDLGSALKDVAKSALSELIGALVKLGIQYVVNAALGQSVAATTTAVSAALAASTATAWAPAAALVSAASFGANALPASEGLVATYAIAETIAALGGFQLGGGTGYTGAGGSSEIKGFVHGNEFVANEQATNNNRPVLEAMNRGAKIGSSGGTKLSVSIENYGTSKDFEVQQLSESEVRIIARDEAKAVVRSDAPVVVAADMANPNSRTSKATQANFNVTRNR